ncbi:MAG: TSUP family transporter [Oscillospiraceae bacterium]|nr:TSUP family transporter [Oscillospiraceae bacterium]
MLTSPSLVTYLIVCPLVFLGGFVDAVAGGGGLISLPAYMIAGLPVHNAIATNKLSSAMGTSVATAKLALDRYIPWKKALPCVIAALIGSGIGARLALMVTDAVFKRIMLVVLPLTAFYILRKKDFSEKPDPLPFWPTLLLSVSIALVIGMYDGFYGPGTGTFLILLLTSLAHFPLGEANGVAKSINLTTNITSLTVYLLNGKVILLLGFVAGLCGVAGNYIGVTFFESRGSRAVKPIMLTVLTIFFIRILSEIL